MKLLITGGAGFIGSAVIRHIIQNTENEILNIDKLTYAGNLESLKEIEQDPKYQFKKIDICDTEQITAAIEEFQPNAIMNQTPKNPDRASLVTTSSAWPLSTTCPFCNTSATSECAKTLR